MFLNAIEPFLPTLMILGAVLFVLFVGYYIFFAPKTARRQRALDKLDQQQKQTLATEEEKVEEKTEVVNDEVIEVVTDLDPEVEPVFVAAEEELQNVDVDDPIEDEKDEESSVSDEPNVEQELSLITDDDLEEEVEEGKPKAKSVKEKPKDPGKYHVLYRKEDNKWYVKREGADKVLRVMETQAEAIAWATIKALNQDTAIVIHKRDGKIRKQNY